MLERQAGRWSNNRVCCCIAVLVGLACSLQSFGQEAPATPAAPSADPTKQATPAAPAQAAKKTQAELEAALSKLLSGASLEGSFTSTTGGRNADRLRTDKYTLGEVKKFEGKTWLIQAKIQYRDSEAVMVPLLLPIEWAGDTPVIVVDNFTIPGMGTFSARVMFYDDHYAGYWKHDDRGGNMFGLVRRAEESKPATERPTQPAPSSPLP